MKAVMPKTPDQWQEAVDAAAGARALADCMMYGLINGPKIDVARCDRILAGGARRKIYPSKTPGELAVALAQAFNDEAAAPVFPPTTAADPRPLRRN